jgi:hypothetical protein
LGSPVPVFCEVSADVYLSAYRRGGEKADEVVCFVGCGDLYWCVVIFFYVETSRLLNSAIRVLM